MLTFPNTLASPAEADQPSLVLDEEGTWQYEGTGVPAVGARNISLGEVVDPLMIGRSGREPEAVLLPLSAIIDNERLNWVLQAGTKLDGDAEPMFKVSWPVWQEHAAQPVDAWLPERDADGVARALALAEREFRLVKEKLDTAGLVRHRLVVLAGRLGQSRRRVAETLGLSTGRVQQLSEDPPDELVNEVDEFVHAAALVADMIGAGSCPREEIPRPRKFGSDQLDELIDSMLTLGLLEKKAGNLELTNDGRALMDTPLGGGAKRKEEETGVDRERASDAAQ
jgi:hypothetical protein